MISLPEVSISFLTVAVSCSGELATTIMPIAKKRSAISGAPSTFTSSLCSRATIAFGVFAGAKTPSSAADSNPGRPEAATVGTFGSGGNGVDVVTASTFTRPGLMNAIAAPTFEFFALYGTAAIYYWVICLVLSFGQARFERRLERYVAK